MPRKPLTNTFAFATSCFVCDRQNPRGMGLRFFLDEDAARVVGEFTPTPEQSGAPNYAHGGASMAVLDDAMAWAIIELAQRFGVTRRAEVDFIRPVVVSQTYHVEAWVDSLEGRTLVARAELSNAEGKLCVGARGIYHALTMDEAVQAIGPAAATAPGYVEGAR